jgi:protein-S-isoprenylcysteine O-methyltransferase Ste14
VIPNFGTLVEIMNSRIIHFRPPRIAIALLSLAVLLHWAVPLSRLSIFSNAAIGTGLLLAGFTIMIWSWWLFRQANTAVCPTEKSGHLVTHGPYVWTRNPMYLGIIGMLLGISVCIGTFPFFCVTALYGFIINGVFCPYEERKLEREFGESYLHYKRKVRRWL